MPGWYSRPVVAVSDTQRAAAFYVDVLGFREDWGFEEGETRIVQVSRQGSEFILWNQWPARVGAARLFVSLDPPDFEKLRAEAEAKGIAREGRWGYRLLVIADPDGNELWFPWPDESQR